MKTYLTHFFGILSVFLLVSCGSSTPDKVATISSQQTAAPAGNLESQTLYYINRYRAQNGLSPLQNHPGLVKLARTHSDDMHQRDDMSHFGFERRAKTAQKKFQMGTMSENLHRSWGIVPTADSIVNQWANSSKHRENMKGNFNYAGMGITQDGDRIFTTLLLGQGVGSNAPSGSPAPFLVF